MSDSPQVLLCCQPNELDEESLVKKMLDIQSGYGAQDTESVPWIKDLKCLSRKHGSETVLPTSDWPRVLSVTNLPRNLGLRDYQQRRLNQLLNKLKGRKHCEDLQHQLGTYLERDDKLTSAPSEARRYMNIMAEEVVEAIRTGRNLYLATLEGSSESCAIFVLDPKDEDGSSVTGIGSNIFTSWSDTIDEVDRRHTNHVSLTVEVNRLNIPRKLPLMTIAGWINGLAFYDGMGPRGAIVHWPEAWMRPRLKRKQSKDQDISATATQDVKRPR